MATVIWTTASGCWTIEAASHDAAYRVAIANRMASGQTAREAVAWFNKDDTLEEVDGPVTDAPYEGELPDDLADDEDA
jgi:hypothetical protein